MMEWVQWLDFQILDWIQQHLKGRALDVMMPLITALGNGGWIFLVLTAGLLISKRYRQQGKTLGGALLLCLLVGNLLLKPMVGRIRPYQFVEGFELLIQPLRDASFPSGHTMAATACAAVFWRYRSTFRGWSVVVLVGAVLMAFSRLYLYVHFPSDVLCGALLGVAMAALSAWVNERLGAKHRNKMQ